MFKAKRGLFYQHNEGNERSRERMVLGGNGLQCLFVLGNEWSRARTVPGTKVPARERTVQGTNVPGNE